MPDAVWAALIGLAGVLAIPIAKAYKTWLHKSGRIDSSAAAELWAESGRIREHLKEEVERLQEENQKQRREIWKLEAKLRAFSEQIEQLQGLLKSKGISVDE